MSVRKGSLLALRDREPAASSEIDTGETKAAVAASSTAPNRKGKKAIAGFFSPEMSFALHMVARKNGMSLQDAMADAFNDWLRKMGESPVGK